MKNSLMFALLAVSAFGTTPSIAGVDLNTYRFECPNASGGTPSERLTNYGSYIRGMGEANTGANKVLAIFRGVASPGIPADLSTGSYAHAGAQYNPATGRITCLFVSNLGNDPFDVSYKAANIRNGWVIKADNSAITIRVMAGLASH
jgi:hypothetical protein